jgi:hypothetical protein
VQLHKNKRQETTGIISLYMQLITNLEAGVTS